MTAHDVAKAVATSYSSPMHYRRHFCVVPRVSWGFGLDHEADILAVTRSGFLWECEIKINASDYRADRSKAKWQKPLAGMRGFYYAMPEILWEKVKDDIRIDGTGVIIVCEHDSGSRFVRTVARCKPNRTSKAITESQMLELGRLGCMRLWDADVVTKFWPQNIEPSERQ